MKQKMTRKQTRIQIPQETLPLQTLQSHSLLQSLLNSHPFPPSR